MVLETFLVDITKTLYRNINLFKQIKRYTAGPINNSYMYSRKW